MGDGNFSHDGRTGINKNDEVRSFAEFQKICEYKTWQDNKCVHENNSARRKINSCSSDVCPIRKKP